MTGCNSRLTAKEGAPRSQACRRSSRQAANRRRRSSTGADSSSATSSTSRQKAYSAAMSSRFGLGNNTKAKARLEALLRVIDWLTGGVTTADWTKSPSCWWANRRSPRGLDCAADGRGGVSGAGGFGDAAPPQGPGQPRQEGHEKLLCDRDDGSAFFA